MVDMYSVLARSFPPFTDSLSSWTFNPLTPIVKEQILLSCPRTFLINVLGEVILNSHMMVYLILISSGVE